MLGEYSGVKFVGIIKEVAPSGRAKTDEELVYELCLVQFVPCIVGSFIEIDVFGDLFHEVGSVRA
jgi:hypothetical protein